MFTTNQDQLLNQVPCTLAAFYTCNQGAHFAGLVAVKSEASNDAMKIHEKMQVHEK